MAPTNQVTTGKYRDMQAMTILWLKKCPLAAISSHSHHTFARVKRLSGKQTSVGVMLRFLDVLYPVHLLNDPCHPYLHLNRSRIQANFERLAIPNRPGMIGAVINLFKEPM